MRLGSQYYVEERIKIWHVKLHMGLSNISLLITLLTPISVQPQIRIKPSRLSLDILFPASLWSTQPTFSLVSRFVSAPFFNLITGYILSRTGSSLERKSIESWFVCGESSETGTARTWLTRHHGSNLVTWQLGKIVELAEDHTKAGKDG